MRAQVTSFILNHFKSKDEETRFNQYDQKESENLQATLSEYSIKILKED